MWSLQLIGPLSLGLFPVLGASSLSSWGKPGADCSVSGAFLPDVLEGPHNGFSRERKMRGWKGLGLYGLEGL